MPRPPRHDRSEALDRAVSVFWAHGYRGTSMKALESALDMRPASLYASFGSKRELFRESLARYTQRSLAELETAIDGCHSPLDGLAAYIRGLAAPGRSPRACLLAKAVLELGPDSSEGGTEADRLLGVMEQRFERSFRDAQRYGELPADSDPQRLARWLQSQVLGLRSYAERGARPLELRQLADDIAAALVGLRHT